MEWRVLGNIPATIAAALNYYHVRLFARNAPVIVAAVLHDVIDDTEVPLSDIQAAFGEPVAGMVSSVSRLSQMNQLLRRSKREVWKVWEAGGGWARFYHS